MSFYDSVSLNDPLIGMGDVGADLVHWASSPHVNDKPLTGITIFQTVNADLQSITSGFLVHQIQSMITMLTAVVGGAVTIYLAWQLYQIMYGKGNQPIMEFAFKCLKIGVIAYFALNAQHYSNDVVRLINGINQSLTEGIMGKGTIAFHLDQILNQALSQLNFCQNQLRLTNMGSWSWIVVIVCILLGYLGFTIETAILVFGSQVIITLLISVGSLFLVALMFEPTKRFFDSWVSKLVEQMLTIMLAMLVSNMMMKMFDFILKVNRLSAVTNPFAISMEVLVVGAISFWALSKCNQLAGSLAGGFALGVMQLSDLSEGAKKSYGFVAPATKPATIPMSYAANKAMGYAKEQWNNRGDNISGNNGSMSGNVADAPKQDNSLKQVQSAINKMNNQNK